MTLIEGGTSGSPSTPDIAFTGFSPMLSRIASKARTSPERAFSSKATTIASCRVAPSGIFPDSIISSVSRIVFFLRLASPDAIPPFLPFSLASFSLLTGFKFLSFAMRSPAQCVSIHAPAWGATFFGCCRPIYFKRIALPSLLQTWLLCTRPHR